MANGFDSPRRRGKTFGNYRPARRLETDRTFRQAGTGEAAEREVSLMEADERAELEAFASGVNRYIEEHHALPLEFTLLRYEPATLAARGYAARGRLHVSDADQFVALGFESA